MTGEYQAILDACVLVQASLRDTLLRLAEKRIFLPRWSDDIIKETVTTLQKKLGKSPEQTDHLVSELKTHFGDAWVDTYEPLVESMTNDPKDRHVVAAAARCGAETIVTFNLKHFPAESLEPWGIEAQSPDDFLISSYDINSQLVIHTLHEQANDLGWDLQRLLQGGLGQAAPKFTHLLSSLLWVRESLF